MNRAVFLDRDGTINVDKNYLYKIEDFEFLQGVIEALKVLKNKGFKLIIITNQSGIARGFYSEKDFEVLNGWMINQLHESGVDIDCVYYCPHLPQAQIEEYRRECECRKPKLGLFFEAAEAFDLDIDNCYSIGDKIRDCSICAVSNCKGYLIGGNESDSVIRSVIDNKYKGVKYAKTLYDAVVDIVGEIDVRYISQ